MPPPKKVLIIVSVCPPTWDGGRLTRVRVPLSPPKRLPHMHMFCTVMLRCESRAGLGEPVEPVVKMTSAPSSAVRVIPASSAESADVSELAFFTECSASPAIEA